ncbi:MAG: hypothetical protein ACREN5_04055, partial [Gemmatimonadales bacterium]
MLALAALGVSAAVLVAVVAGLGSEPAGTTPDTPATGGFDRERDGLTSPASQADTTATPAARQRPVATVAPVQPFGRSTVLDEDAKLHEAIAAVLGERAGEFSVVVVRPADGRSAFVDADRVFYSASLFKLAVLYEAGLRLSRGELFLD